MSASKAGAAAAGKPKVQASISKFFTQKTPSAAGDGKPAETKTPTKPVAEPMVIVEDADDAPVAKQSKADSGASRVQKDTKAKPVEQPAAVTPKRAPNKAAAKRHRLQVKDSDEEEEEKSDGEAPAAEVAEEEEEEEVAKPSKARKRAARPSRAKKAAVESDAEDGMEEDGAEPMQTDDVPRNDASHMDLSEFSRAPDSSKRKERRLQAPKLPDKSKLTPLEQQFVEIKEKYPDAILFVECGYKFRFFGEDAEIAARELNIMCFPDHEFMTASIPTHRLNVHVCRLVAAGYKVGVVRQRETAALKKASSNRSGPFVRELTNLYTKATMIGDVLSADEPVETSGGGTNFLMCLWDEPINDKGDARIAMVAVHLATGEIIFDEFEDSYSRTELDTRLTHIQPCELLLPKSLSARTEATLAALPAAEDGPHGVRRERCSMADDATAAKAYLSQFLAEDVRPSPFFCVLTLQASGVLHSHVVRSLMDLPKGAAVCMAALVQYLREFKLERVLLLSAHVQPFSLRGFEMVLPASSLRNLEILQNASDGGQNGSLLWTLDRTHTSEIQERHAAVEFAKDGGCVALQKLGDLLKGLPDLERGICNLFYKKCNSVEFASLVAALRAVNDLVTSFKGPTVDAIPPGLLRAPFEDVPKLLQQFLKRCGNIDMRAAKESRKTELFLDDSEYPDVARDRKGIDDVTGELKRHRSVLREQLKNPNFEYTKVNGVEYLIELSATNKKIPDDWMVISTTKQYARYHSPYIQEKLEELSRHRELLDIDAAAAWADFLDKCSQNYDELKRAVHVIASMDCIFSFAEVAKQQGYCKPTLTDVPQISISRGRHPVVETLLAQQFVPNDTSLVGDAERCMVITGPNMGGKSCYIRQVALIVVMAQVGSFVPAESATIGLVDGIFTRMGAADNIYQQSSTFLVELREASQIMALATNRSLVIMDELGRGTSTHDGVAIAYAVLYHLAYKINCFALFVTHYPSLSQLSAVFPENIGCYHMAFVKNSDEANSLDVLLLHELVKGVADRSYGLNVARLAGVPKEILQSAAAKAAEAESVHHKKRAVDGLQSFVIENLWRAVRDKNADAVLSWLDLTRRACVAS